jgi:hypothetical protein
LNRALAPLGFSLVRWDTHRHLRREQDVPLHKLAVLAFQADQAFGSLAARKARPS